MREIGELNEDGGGLTVESVEGNCIKCLKKGWETKILKRSACWVKVWVP